jgi:3',5'-cyclic AMP phosphodiesterase CpdA
MQPLTHHHLFDMKPLNLKFAIVSDLHIALAHTFWDSPTRCHLVEVSIPALELVLQQLSRLDLDFLLLPGDLTQHGEPENHRWLSQRLAQLPYPAYVIPGNHDVPVLDADRQSIGWGEFPGYYRAFGYDNCDRLYYTCEVQPGVRLIGLNSNQFDAQGVQQGYLDRLQLDWLAQVLADARDELVLVMVHHNAIEHLPGQSQSALGRRYMLDNAEALLDLLRQAGVQLVFSGHLHVQDIAYDRGIYDITTGSLVSYPHPYRVLNLHTDDRGKRWLQIESGRVEAVPGWDTLLSTSREFMGDRSYPYMVRLLMDAPFRLSAEEAEFYAPDLRYFWADIANGDALLEFPHIPAKIARFLQQFNAIAPDGTLALIDNHITLRL